MTQPSSHSGFRSLLYGFCLLLLHQAAVVRGQADGPATCVRTWQLSLYEDLLQSCEQPSSAVNVVVENNNVINILGGGGRFELLEGDDAVDEDVIVRLLQRYRRQSILAVVVENNKGGIINVEESNSGNNTGCRDNSSGNNLVTVGGTVVTNAGTMNAYANGGVVILVLMKRSRGEVNIGRRMQTLNLPSDGRSNETRTNATAITSDETLSAEYFNEQVAHLERRETAAGDRRLDDLNCDETPGFETICWWLFLLRGSGREDGTETCEDEYNCGPNPCPPPQANNNNNRPTRAPSSSADDNVCATPECCIPLITKDPGCNCGLFVRGDRCWWELAKEKCLGPRPGKEDDNKNKITRSAWKLARDVLKKTLRPAYKEWCEELVEQDANFRGGFFSHRNRNRRRGRRRRRRIRARR